MVWQETANSASEIARCPSVLLMILIYDTGLLETNYLTEAKHSLLLLLASAGTLNYANRLSEYEFNESDEKMHYKTQPLNRDCFLPLKRFSSSPPIVPHQVREKLLFYCFLYSEKFSIM